MRRKHSEITDLSEIQRILDSVNIGRLATIGTDGYPYITPVNFASLNGNIYFHCAPKGEKLDNIARDAKVCFEVDAPLAYFDIGFDPKRPTCHVHQFYHCVIIRGMAFVVQDDLLKTEALNALMRKHEPDTSFEPVNKTMSAYKACKVVEIRPISTTAKSDLVQNQPAEVRKKIAEYFTQRNLPYDRETVEAMGFVFK
jgi:nitroimidazol reductase NimA-like FMN-containing flavoprotein (pyridoxamine 5'-phosphate oxidase superfamily)